jgi:hypothetical protein
LRVRARGPITLKPENCRLNAGDRLLRRLLGVQAAEISCYFRHWEITPVWASTCGSARQTIDLDHDQCIPGANAVEGAIELFTLANRRDLLAQYLGASGRL